jgi:hypothetical protein
MSQLRSILLSANRTADYTQPQLIEQAQQVDVDALRTIGAAILKRATVIAHAIDVMCDGTHTHPMQAFLHASECLAINEDAPLSDDDFYVALAMWGQINEQALRSNTAMNVSPGSQSQQAFNLFAERFMRSE